MNCQFPKGGITETVLAAGAKEGQGFLVSGCAITLVSGKTITGNLIIKVNHEGVTGCLGKDGRCSDAEAALIPFEQGGLGNGNFWKK